LKKKGLSVICLSSPTPVKQIKLFERINNVSVYVYGLVMKITFCHYNIWIILKKKKIILTYFYIIKEKNFIVILIISVDLFEIKILSINLN